MPTPSVKPASLRRPSTGGGTPDARRRLSTGAKSRTRSPPTEPPQEVIQRRSTGSVPLHSSGLSAPANRDAAGSRGAPKRAAPTRQARDSTSARHYGLQLDTSPPLRRAPSLRVASPIQDASPTLSRRGSSLQFSADTPRGETTRGRLSATPQRAPTPPAGGPGLARTLSASCIPPPPRLSTTGRRNSVSGPHATPRSASPTVAERLGGTRASATSFRSTTPAGRLSETHTAPTAPAPHIAPSKGPGSAPRTSYSRTSSLRDHSRTPGSRKRPAPACAGPHTCAESGPGPCSPRSGAATAARRLQLSPQRDDPAGPPPPPSPPPRDSHGADDGLDTSTPPRQAVTAGAAPAEIALDPQEGPPAELDLTLSPDRPPPPAPEVSSDGVAGGTARELCSASPSRSRPRGHSGPRSDLDASPPRREPSLGGSRGGASRSASASTAPRAAAEAPDCTAEEPAGEQSSSAEQPLEEQPQQPAEAPRSSPAPRPLEPPPAEPAPAGPPPDQQRGATPPAEQRAALSIGRPPPAAESAPEEVETPLFTPLWTPTLPDAAVPRAGPQREELPRHRAEDEELPPGLAACPRRLVDAPPARVPSAEPAPRGSPLARPPGLFSARPRRRGSVFDSASQSRSRSPAGSERAPAPPQQQQQQQGAAASHEPPPCPAPSAAPPAPAAPSVSPTARQGSPPARRSSPTALGRGAASASESTEEGSPSAAAARRVHLPYGYPCETLEQHWGGQQVLPRQPGAAGELRAEAALERQVTRAQEAEGTAHGAVLEPPAAPLTAVQDLVLERPACPAEAAEQPDQQSPQEGKGEQRRESSSRSGSADWAQMSNLVSAVMEWAKTPGSDDDGGSQDAYPRGLDAEEEAAPRPPPALRLASPVALCRSPSPEARPPPAELAAEREAAAGRMQRAARVWSARRRAAAFREQAGAEAAGASAASGAEERAGAAAPEGGPPADSPAPSEGEVEVILGGPQHGALLARSASRPDGGMEEGSRPRDSWAPSSSGPEDGDRRGDSVPLPPLTAPSDSAFGAGAPRGSPPPDASWRRGSPPCRPRAPSEVSAPRTQTSGSLQCSPPSSCTATSPQQQPRSSGSRSPSAVPRTGARPPGQVLRRRLPAERPSSASDVVEVDAADAAEVDAAAAAAEGDAMALSPQAPLPPAAPAPAPPPHPLAACALFIAAAATLLASGVIVYMFATS